MSHTVHIYTDGAASGNPGPGGYGAVMLFGPHRKEISEGYRLTTNNRMELLAVIKAFKLLKKNNLEVHLFSDSKYVIDAFLKNWISNWVIKDFKKVKNSDLWRELLPLVNKQRVHFFWVKGHSTNIENNRCDELAVAAYQNKNELGVDEGYESGLYN